MNLIKGVFNRSALYTPTFIPRHLGASYHDYIHFHDLLLANESEELFMSELCVQMLRIQDLNFNDSQQLQKAIQILERFEALAEEIHLHDDMDELWESIQKAREGDPSALKTIVVDFKRDVLDSDESMPASAQLPEEKEENGETKRVKWYTSDGQPVYT